MNLKFFLKNLAHTLDTPDAVSSLRRVILDLAMRGKLVPQNPKDEPASKLLKQIKEEKIKLEKAGKISPAKPLPPLTDSKNPFSIPTSWEWVKMDTIALLVRGITFSSSMKEIEKNKGNIPCFRSGNIQRNLIWDNFVYVPLSIPKKSQMVQKNDILFSIANSYELVGKTSFADNISHPVTFGAFLAAIRITGAIPMYMYHYLNSNYSTKSLRIRSSQTTNIANITFATLRNHTAPLPPLAEQRRIVTKVDALMSLCDKLEIVQQERDKARERFTASVLDKLTSPAQPFAKSARFMLSHFADIITRPEHVKELRRVILDMAVRGKLVSQNPKDEPASKLLKQIKEEKVKLEKAGKVKPFQSLPPLADSEKPFVVPNKWEWQRLGDICIYDAGIKVNSHDLLADKWVLDLEDIEKNTGRLIQKAIVSSRESKSTKSSFLKGDVLYGKLRPYLNKVLVAQEHGYSTTEIVSLRPYLGICPEYIALCLKRSDFHEYVIQHGQGTKMPRLRRDDAVKSSFPLPPFAEQKRIISKVDVLMSLCDQLELALADSRNNRRRLLNSLLNTAA